MYKEIFKFTDYQGRRISREDFYEGLLFISFFMYNDYHLYESQFV